MKLFIGDFTQENIQIDADEMHHMAKVLRMENGDEIYLTDGKGNLAKGRIAIVGKKVNFLLEERFPMQEDDPPRLHIAIAPTKNIDRFEFFLEKATELGVSKITPILCRNSERKQLNIDKLRKQVISACKQSKRVFFPEIEDLVKVEEFIDGASSKNIFVGHCYQEFEKKPIKDILNNVEEDTIFMVGPEGDFSKQEIEMLYKKEVKGVDLGKNILRLETAGIHIASSFYLMKN